MLKIGHQYKHSFLCGSKLFIKSGIVLGGQSLGFTVLVPSCLMSIYPLCYQYHMICNETRISRNGYDRRGGSDWLVVGETAGGPRSASPLIDVEGISDEAGSPRATSPPPPPPPSRVRPRAGQSEALPGCIDHF